MSYMSSDDTDDATSSVYSAKVSTRSSRKPSGTRIGDGETPPVNFVWVSGKGHVCNNCKKEFRTKSQWTKHELYCKQLETIRGENVVCGGGGGVGGSGGGSVGRNTVTPSNQELFAIIQDLTLKYNKVNDELNELKKWAKKAGTIATNNGVVGIIPFSVTRHKKQMVEDILNRYYIDGCTFRKWYTKPDTFAITNDDLALVFSRDLVDGISNVVNRVVYNAWYKNGSFELVEEDASTSSGYIPFRPYEQKSGMFHVFEVPYKQLISNKGLDDDDNDNDNGHYNGYNHSDSDQDAGDKYDEHGHMYSAAPPSWRFIENEEYNDFISHIHKRFLKKFKEWQDINMELQHKMSVTMVSSSSSSSGEENDSDNGYVNKHVEANDVPLSEEFSTLYNRNADKVMGGNVPILKLYARIREKITFKQVCNYTVS
jgi:hypothetical protein